LDEDEAGHSNEAVQLYSEAVELCLAANKKSKDKKLSAELTKIAGQALGRAEQLKGVSRRPTQMTQTTAQTATRLVPPLGLEGLNLREAPASEQPGGAAAASHRCQFS
jgi:calpain-7